jgi:N-acetyl-anhydromuramyl-L-alanine amidase AmpD
VTVNRGHLHQFNRLFPWRTTLVLCLLSLAGCRSGYGWRVLDLPAVDLPRHSEEQLAQCEATLGLAPELSSPADSTNFGERQQQDVHGRRVPHAPRLIVLHETVIPAKATIRLFQTAHPRDEDQLSYHMLVDHQGRRLRIVPDQKRAYGAGMSAFGDFTVRIHPDSVGSINNVSLHLSLESPADGGGEGDSHSGYTQDQYATLAAQVLLWQARHGIPMSRLTTHAAVDRSHSRYDPRSFRWERFDQTYRTAARRCGLEMYDNGRASF